MKYYTGIGSRQTPPSVLDTIRKISSYCIDIGLILRSGGADGADSAFEDAAKDKCEIYLPWRNFNNCYNKLNKKYYVLDDLPDNQLAQELAAQVHPAWHNCTQGVKKLHTRNVYQVLGKDLSTPSDFVVCYCILNKDNVPQGGTATAYNLANVFKIPLFNLYKEEDLAFLRDFLRIRKRDLPMNAHHERKIIDKELRN